MRGSIAVLVLVLGGCMDSRVVGDAGSDAGPLAPFGEAQFALRCEASGDCAGPIDVDICGFHRGEPCDAVRESPTVLCEIRRGPGGEPLVTATVRQEGHQLQFAQTVGGCDVNVQTAPGESYAGSCSSACTISDVEESVEDGRLVVSGNVRCDGMRSYDTSITATREITSAGVDSTGPGRFRLSGCVGG